MKWFRFYQEFIDDPKISMMSESDQLLWVKALCLASDSKIRGVITLTDEEIAWKLRITTETWRHAIDKFRAKGMVEHAEGGYKIVNWDYDQKHRDHVVPVSKGGTNETANLKTACKKCNQSKYNKTQAGWQRRAE